MDGRCSSEPRNSEPEEVGIAPENNSPSPPGDPKAAQPISSSHKRRCVRRSGGKLLDFKFASLFVFIYFLKK